jgi:cyclopropane fatty-acyl-phospholipid synthase-like methyltransferase
MKPRLGTLADPNPPCPRFQSHRESHPGRYGSGDLLYLAQLGYQVIGIDFVDTAIAHAQEKIGSLPPEVASLLNFQVADALKPSLLQRQFASVVDSGFLHLFNPYQCDRFIEDLALTLLPGGRYYLHEFAIEFPIPNVPRQVTEDELRARFLKGWHIRHPVGFLSRVSSSASSAFERRRSSLPNSQCASALRHFL